RRPQCSSTNVRVSTLSAREFAAGPDAWLSVAQRRRDAFSQKITGELKNGKHRRSAAQLLRR
ncbi:hypothetical protein, partial [Tardiphaga sp.]|uniref:hypothetical protein n=1 Tax=Tardiphaga sp. TaxID=1926292 RepID=UPI0025D54D7A